MTSAAKVRLFETTAELAKLRAGLDTKEQEKAVLQMHLQQQHFAVKKMSMDLTRQKSNSHKESELMLAAKDQQIEQLGSILQQKESAVQQLYEVLKQQQEALTKTKPQSEQKQSKFELLDPEVLAKIKISPCSGPVSAERKTLPGPRKSAAAAAAASFVTHLNNAARQVTRICY